MEIGVYSFGEADYDDQSGQSRNVEQRMQHLVEEIELADQVGLDVFGVGEHHRPDYAVSAPSVILAAAASRTRQIRLTSAVTVLSSDDPVRVFQQFSTLDLLSSGRAEIMVGRGSFIESFPLFGYDLKDYDELFLEKLQMLLQIRESERITWSGEYRALINDRGIYPRPVQNPLPVWIAVGGTPQSAFRAGVLGVPMALAIIGGDPERFVQFAEWHRQGAEKAGREVPALSINSHGFLADESDEAADIAFPAFKAAMDRIGAERGWPPMTRSQFEASRTLRGANFVGNAEEVTEKILHQHKLFGHERFLLQLTVGTLPHDKVMRAIEILGTQVAPAVRDALGVKKSQSSSPV